VSLSDRECSESGFLRSDVILNGGEAAVRDLTLAESYDVVGGDPRVLAAHWIPVAVLPLLALRKVPRRAIALLRMTARIVCI
jgi:hypothetical protein